MAITPEVTEDILRTYKQTRGSPYKTARMCGVSIGEVFKVVETNQDKLAVAQERYGGWGRPEIQQHLVARRDVNQLGWNNKDSEIAKARDDFEAGTHEMATGRDGQWLLLYSFPRKRRAPNREGYFLPEIA